MASVFSKIIDGELPGRFCWVDEKCVVFASINPISDGHMLVVPREEISKYTDAPDHLLSHLMTIAKKVGLALEMAFDAPRAGLLVAGFEVPHLHIHVVPAWGEGELSFANAKESVPGEELDEATEKVRQALRTLGYGRYIPQDMNSAVLG